MNESIHFKNKFPSLTFVRYKMLLNFKKCMDSFILNSQQSYCIERVLASLKEFLLRPNEQAGIAVPRCHLGIVGRRKCKAFTIGERTQLMVNHRGFTLENTRRPKKGYFASRTGPKRAISKAVTSPEDRLGENCFGSSTGSLRQIET